VIWRDGQVVRLEPDDEPFTPQPREKERRA
jgi:hypothetical protein